MSEISTPEISTPTADERLVRIVSLDGDEFDEVAEYSDEELAAHLAQWDYGVENDGAATINGYTPLPEAERFGARPITHDGLQYWIAADKDLRICSLLRRPLTRDTKD